MLEFLSASEHPRLAALVGPSAPTTFLRTKVKPMVLDLPADASIDDAKARLAELHEVYRTDDLAYYDRHAGPDSPAIRGADPAIVLVPGVGMFSYGKDKQTARVAGEFYLNAINVTTSTRMTVFSEKRLSSSPSASGSSIRFWMIRRSGRAP